MADHTIIGTSIQDRAHKKDIPLDLRSPGYLAKWPIIGIMMFIFGALVFGAFTYDLYAQGPLVQVDKQIANTLPVIGLHSSIIIKYIMDAGFYLGKDVVIVLSLFHGIYFLYKRYYQELTMVLVGLVTSSSLFWILSHIIGRPRPPDQIWIIVNIPGFPSGHAVAIVAFYGLLAYLLVPKMPSTFWKVFVVAVTILIIAFIGFSRIFTGGHYLTDILAGYAVGFAWSGLIYTLIEVYFQKRRSRNVQKD